MFSGGPEMFSDVFSSFQMFSETQDALNLSQIFYRDSQMCSDVLRCSQMFSDDQFLDFL